MPTSGSERQHQSGWSHDMPVNASGRRTTAGGTRTRRPRRPVLRPPTRASVMERWKLAPEAARERRQAASGGLAVLEDPVALPLPGAQPEPQSVLAGARQTILVVEDDPRAAGVIRESLELE